MTDSTHSIDEIRFDVRDPTITHVYVYLSAHGDSPFFVQGWHHQVYPATMTTLELHKLIVTTGAHDPVTWPREAPPELKTTEAGELARAILTWDMGMDSTKPGWAYWEGLRMLAESVIGERTKA